MVDTTIEVLIQALNNYLTVHSKRIISFLKLTNQQKVMIEIRALYRYFTPSIKYARLEDVIKELIAKNVTEIGDTEIILKTKNSNAYLEVPISYIENVIK